MDRNEWKNELLNLAAELVVDIQHEANENPNWDKDWSEYPNIKTQLEIIKSQHGQQMVDAVISRVNQRLMNR